MNHGHIGKVFWASALSCLSSTAAFAQEATPAPTAPGVAPLLAPEPSFAPTPIPTPAPAPPTAAPQAPTAAHPAFWTNQPGLSFHYVKLAREGSSFVPGKWNQLCLEGCDHSLMAGSYRLALASGANEPVMAPGVFKVTPSSRFEGAYSDRSSTRLAGALVLGLGGVSGLSTLAVGIGTSSISYDREDGIPLIVGGIVGTLLSLAIGIPLAATPDEARIQQTAK